MVCSRLSQHAQAQRGAAFVEDLLVLCLILLVSAASIGLVGRGSAKSLFCTQEGIQYAFNSGGGSSTTEEGPEARGPDYCGFSHP